MSVMLPENCSIAPALLYLKFGLSGKSQFLCSPLIFTPVGLIFAITLHKEQLLHFKCLQDVQILKK
jgi:hypothetical protein